jgi:hypothetical protein
MTAGGDAALDGTDTTSPDAEPLTSGDSVWTVDNPWDVATPEPDGSTWELMQDDGSFPAWL